MPSHRRALLLCPLFYVLHACSGGVPATREAPTGSSPAPSQDQEWFTDRAHDVGLDFVHFNGMSGEFYYPEVMPPGVGLFDYDNDGDLDVLVTQGQMLGSKTPNQALYPPRDVPPNSRLFRNDLVSGSTTASTLKFTDVTRESGIVTRGYAMGMASGDFNNDGCIDLYITHLGPNQLFRNTCDGKFVDVSKQSRTEDSGWSISAAFVDFDRDGWLDLFVGHYLIYSLEINTPCFSLAGTLDYCPPHVYRPEPSKLYHNNRDGTFTDATKAAAIAGEFGPALGVATADFNGDGWVDIYVANDGQANQLWTNQQNGTFKNTALLAGAALSAEGVAKSSMGVDAGDFDNDGDDDLFVTELTGQGIELFVNDGSGVFEDLSARAGLRLPTLARTGFGTAWFDFDNDGWLDVMTVNGAVTHDVEALARKERFSLHQRKQLFRNLGQGRFEDVTDAAGAVFQLSEVGRGAAFGDVDNDGDTDVVVGNDSGPLRLLINNVGARKHWLGLRLVGQDTPRDLVGARAEIVRTDGSTLSRRARADGSYASANDPRVLVGLGDSASISKVRVRWPNGLTEEWREDAVDRYITLRQGSGTALGEGTQ